MAEKQAAGEPNWFEYDKIQVPMDLGVAEVDPTPEMWDRYRKCMGDDQVFITNALRPRSIMTYRVMPTRPGEQHINAGHQAQYFNAPIPGKKLVMHAVIIDKYIRRGKPYVITETEIKDEDGRLIERNRRTSMVSSPKLGQKWWAKPTRDAEVGAALDPVVKTFDLKLMTEFEAIYGMGRGVGASNFHSDDEAARKAGLREPVASAHMTISFMHDLLNKFFGHGWINGGTLDVKFIRPIMAGDRVAYKGVVTSKEPEGDKVRLHLELWTENQRDQRTAVAKASALVD